jgi:hypothetical protein
MIPWSSLAWAQVHAGHLPLWNPYSGLGLPLAFNWQSAAFSLPMVIGYAFPLHIAYTVQIVVSLVVAGSGAYMLARVLHLGVIGCATAGTVYELSGSFMGWLGWPHAAVMSWAGWLLAMTILIVRGGHRIRNIAAFAVFTALALYSGQPEILTILLVSVAVFFITMVTMKVATQHNLRLSLRPLLDFILAIVAGAALGAPLLLPGMQVLARSTRSGPTLLARTEVGKSLPPHDLVHLLVQGYNGLPITGSEVFGDAVYFDTAAYVGVIAIALAVLGVVRRRCRPGVVSLLVLSIVTLGIVFFPPVEAIFLHLPLVQTIDWHRDLMILGLCVAVLAGVGMDVLVRSATERSIQRLLGGVLVACVVLLVVLWWTGGSGLSPLDAGLRRDSLKLPLVCSALALVAVTGLAVWTSKRRHPASVGAAPGSADSGTRGRTDSASVRDAPIFTAGRVVGGLLLVLETVFLVASGAQLWSSSDGGITITPAVATLEQTVGSATVGFGAFTCFDGPAVTALGILPEANSLYGVHEFDLYDPILPHAYLQAWAQVSQSPAGVPIYNSLCPTLTTAEQARRFGVQYVLERLGTPGPTGSVFVRNIDDESLYQNPGAAAATLTPLGSDGRLPSDDAPGTPVKVDHRSPSAWKMTTAGDQGQVLRLRLTNEPGWHATVDGRPLELVPYAGVMLQAIIPPGNHVIELQYWPQAFTVGLILAACCLVVLLTASAIALIDRRRSLSGSSSAESGPRSLRGRRGD